MIWACFIVVGYVLDHHWLPFQVIEKITELTQFGSEPSITAAAVQSCYTTSGTGSTSSSQCTRMGVPWFLAHFAFSQERNELHYIASGSAECTASDTSSTPSSRNFQCSLLSCQSSLLVQGKIAKGSPSFNTKPLLVVRVVPTPYESLRPSPSCTAAATN